MGFNKDIIARVVEDNDILDIIGEYVTLKKAGTNFKGICPFHTEKTPSFIVSPNKQIFHCFGCHEGGDAVTFLMKIEHISFPEAVKMLGKRVGVELKDENQVNAPNTSIKEKLFDTNLRVANFYCRSLTQSKNAESARQYIKKRNILKKTRDTFLLGYSPKSQNFLINAVIKSRIDMNILEKAGLIRKSQAGDNKFKDWFWDRIIFPISDVKGRIVGFGGRVLNDTLPKYINSPETALFNKRATLYGLNNAIPHIREAKRVIVLEGYMDVIALYQGGIKNVVATLGTALTSSHISVLKRYCNEVIVVFDGDNAGISASFKAVELFLNSGINCKIASLPKGLDPEEYLNKYGSEKLNQLFKETNDSFNFLINQIVGNENIDTLQGKQKVCEKIFPIAAQIESALERNYVIRLLSYKLKEREKDLFYELERYNKSKKKRFVNREQPGHSTNIKETWSILEIDFLRFLLYNPNLIEEAKKELDTNWIQNKSIREIVEWLCNFSDKFKNYKSGTLYSMIVNEFNSNEMTALMSFLSKDDEKEGIEPGKVLKDILNKLGRFYLTLRLKSLEKEIESNKDYSLAKDKIIEHEKISRQLKE